MLWDAAHHKCPQPKDRDGQEEAKKKKISFFQDLSAEMCIRQWLQFYNYSTLHDPSYAPWKKKKKNEALDFFLSFFSAICESGGTCLVPKIAEVLLVSS